MADEVERGRKGRKRGFGREDDIRGKEKEGKKMVS